MPTVVSDFLFAQLSVMISISMMDGGHDEFDHCCQGIHYAPFNSRHFTSVSFCELAT
jgi:hypothetical protein